MGSGHCSVPYLMDGGRREHCGGFRSKSRVQTECRIRQGLSFLGSGGFQVICRRWSLLVSRASPVSPQWSKSEGINKCAHPQSTNKLILILTDGKVTLPWGKQRHSETSRKPPGCTSCTEEVNKRWTVSTPTLTCSTSFFHFSVFLFAASCFVTMMHAYPVLETATAHPFMGREC